MSPIQLSDPAGSSVDNSPKTNGEPLTPEEIEMINAHGPFNHSVWRGRGYTFTHEEGLAGRVEFLSNRLREVIKKEFSDDQLSRMSIVDVGCYDGWLLESLSDLPFARMVGIEPRRENIERGRRVRAILKTPSRIHYQTGEIDTLDDKEPFDIVICMGVLHHLESIPVGLKKLKEVCRRLLIVETLCLPSRHLTPALKADAEMKDMVYRYKPQICGITLQRYEGRYSPGSGVHFAVVNVPSAESMFMHLDMLGFHKVNVVADWNSFRQAMPNNFRPISAICLSALIEPNESTNQDSEETRWVEDYETRMTSLVLPENLIVPLYHRVCGGDETGKLPLNARLVCLSIYGPKWLRGWFRKLAFWRLADPTRREIVAAFQFCPIDKIRLEYAKHLLTKGECAEATSELQQITRRPSADWRACYRAFYLLWRAALLGRDEAAAARFRDYCLTCNPNYPPALFNAPPPFQV